MQKFFYYFEIPDFEKLNVYTYMKEVLKKIRDKKNLLLTVTGCCVKQQPSFYSSEYLSYACFTYSLGDTPLCRLKA